MTEFTSPAALLEYADGMFVAGRFEQALRHYLALVQQPVDLYAWYGAARTLCAWDGATESDRELLQQAGEAAAEGGRLLVALAAVRGLRDAAPARAATLAERIGGLYGKSSSRVAQRASPRPPGPPLARVRSGQLELERVLERGDALRDEARARCQQAWRSSRAEQRDAKQLPFHPLLCELDSPLLGELSQVLELRGFASGAEILAQGEPGTAMFIIVRGTARIVRDGEQLAFLRSGAFFGEMALLTRDPRTATVIAETPLWLLELDRDQLEEIAGRQPEVATVLGEYTRQRLLHTLVATSPLLRPLDRERRVALVELFEPRVVEAGDVVVREGEPTRGLFVVLSGRVQVTKRDSDSEERVALAELAVGESFGEISLIRRTPASATITAADRSVLLHLAREDFDREVGRFPEVLAHIYQLAGERDATNEQLAASTPVPLDDDAPLI